MASEIQDPPLSFPVAPTHIVMILQSLNFPRLPSCPPACSGESEPGDRERVGGGGRDGHHQLQGEEQRRLRHPAAQPQQTDHLLQGHET